ncbi:MAG: hypothetical protein ACRD2T_05975 [Thermoanaerobaculia bacterium]
MTIGEAIAFVRRHGVVLESACGPVPNLAEAIAGAPIRGSWWSHARGGEIFKLTRAVRDSSEVLVCRWVGGKITYVHRRLWPALVRLAGRFPREQLAQVREIHTPSGQHNLEEVPFPKWVSASLSRTAAKLDESKALRALSRPGRRSVRSRTKGSLRATKRGVSHPF